MATHKSAKKRARQALKRRERNRQYVAQVRTAVKKLKTAIASGSATVESLGTLFTSAQSVLAKAAQKGILHSNSAQRRISRLALAIGKNQAAKDGKVATTDANKARKAAPKKSAAAIKAATVKKRAESSSKKNVPAKKKK